MKQEKESTIQAQTSSAQPARHMKRRVAVVIVSVFLCIVAGFGGGWLAVWIHSEGRLGQAARVDEMIRSDGSTVVTTDEELISKVATKVAPSVVSVVTSSGGTSRYDTATQGAGTGVIISKDGYIMTNNHVIDGARKIAVISPDGTEYDNVRRVGSDPLNDIAFLKIDDVDTLTPAQLGDSRKVRIGQRVVAIGNALGQFQNTVTSGIISATGRPLVASSADGTTSESLTDLIQTDAAINSGNSGGPLVDLSGRVIGINTAVATDANGIGFAIPINATRGVIEGVLEDGQISRAYLGVHYLDITPELAATNKLDSTYGAYVVTRGKDPVIRGGPADKAGIKPGDIIIKVNDETIGTRSNMSSVIGQYRPGTEVELTVLRKGKQMTVKVTLDAYRER